MEHAATFFAALPDPTFRRKYLKELLHRLIYSLVGEPNPGMDLDQWKCPLTCWFALSSLRYDGKYQEATEYTRVLAQWTFHLRVMYYYQARSLFDLHPEQYTKEGFIG